MRQSQHYNITDIFEGRTELTEADNITTVGERLDIVSDYLNKNYFLFVDSILLIVDLRYRTGKSSVHIHGDSYQTSSMHPTFFEFSPYFQEFNDRISRLILGGFYGGGTITRPSKRQAVEDIEPQKLTYEQLELGFLACLIPLVLSIGVFMIEIAVHYVQTQIPRISLYFAVKAYQERVVIGPEKLQIKEVVEESIEVTSVKSEKIENAVDADDDDALKSI